MYPFLSIVIPAFNEENRIEKTLDSIFDFTERAHYRIELIVVDDGSIDHTAELVEAYRKKPRCKEILHLVKNSRNFGKGYSVRKGMIQSTGEIVLFTDADLSAPIEETKKLISPILNRHYEIAIGSRALEGSQIGIHQTKSREMAGRIFNHLVRKLTGLEFKDTQCGFKAFHRSVIKRIFKRQRCFDFSFDVEVLYIAKKLGYRIIELPVRWNHMEGTKVNMLRDPIKMFLSLFVIRLNDLQGKYH